MRNSQRNAMEIALLVIAFLVQGMAFAQTPKSHQQQILKHENTLTHQQNPDRTFPKILKNLPPFASSKSKEEDISKRNIFSKHFRNEDGSHTAIIGISPIHYEKNGAFLEIDHQILSNPDFKYPQANTTNLFESYYGATSQDGIKNKTAEGEVLEFLNTQMYWETNGQAVNRLQSTPKTLRTDGNKAYYDGIYGEISAEFITLTGKRKLNYIIPNKLGLGHIPQSSDYLVFSEDIILPFGWSALITEAGILIKNPSGKDIYLYEKPVSTDASHELSPDSNTIYETFQIGNTLTIRTKVKTSWLLHPERIFPVKVDPTILVYPNLTTSRTGYCTPSNGEYGNIRVGHSNQNYYYYGFASFDTNSIPDTAPITSTVLHQYVAQANDMGTARGIHLKQFLALPTNFQSFSDLFIAFLYETPTYQTVSNLETLGWRNITLGTTANQDLQNRLHLNNFTIKYMPVGTFTNNQNITIYGMPDPDGLNREPYLEVTYTETSRQLVVSGAFTGASHTDGTHHIAPNSILTVTSGTREGYAVTGWTGTGSVPPSGNGGSASFAITQNSSINWIWEEVGCTNTTIWNGMTWSNGIPNSPHTMIIIDNNFVANTSNTLNQKLVGCSFEILRGNIVIPTGYSIIIENEIEIEPGVSFTLQDDANLIQINEDDVQNTGHILVERTFRFSPERNQYNFVNSPVIGQNIKEIYNGQPKAQYYRESTNSFVFFNGDYVPGRGQALSEPSPSDEQSNKTTAVFEGVPFNGSFTLAELSNTHTGFHLVGNPYPSALDLDSLYVQNPDLERRFLFWDNRGNTQITQYGDGYQGQHYAQYNAESGTGIPAAGVDSDLYKVRIPNGKLAVASAVMTRLIDTVTIGEIHLNNSQRTTAETQKFFGKNLTQEKDRYWLSLSTPSQMSMINAIVYYEGGKDEYGWEDSKASSSSENIYSILGNHKLSIQGKPAFNISDTIQLGYKSFQSGTYKIDLHKTEGVFSHDVKIILIDLENEISHNLIQEGAYKFNSSEGTFAERFLIVYQISEQEDPEDPEDPEEPEEPMTTLDFEETGLIVYKQGKETVIFSSKSKLEDLKVFNLNGQILLNQKKIQTDTFRFHNNRFGKQPILLKVKTMDGKTHNLKIISH